MTWQDNVGTPGGMRVRTTIYTNIPAGSSRTIIQAALNACPSNQVVKLAEGTYTITSQTLLIPSFVTLRGSGTNTFITGNGGQPVAIAPWNGWKAWEQETTNGPAAAHTNWIAGFTKGTTQITLTNADAFEVGQLIMLDTLNDTNTSVYGSTDNEFKYTSYEYTSEASPGTGYDRAKFEVNRIAAKDGNIITLESGLLEDYAPSLSPQAWHFATAPAKLAGIEDLTVLSTSGNVDGPLYFHVTANCWASNVNVTVNTPGSQVRGFIFVRWSDHATVFHCWVAGNREVDHYGIRLLGSSRFLVENNISDGPRIGICPNSCMGGVVAYNLITNCQTTGFWWQPGLDQHGGFPHLNLYEGNITPGLGAGTTWGGSKDITWFRNRAGNDSDPGGSHGNREVMWMGATNRFQNVIGNVLGNAAFTNYRDTCGSCSGTPIFYIGPFIGGQQCNGVCDPTVLDTAIIALNYTTGTTTNNGVQLGGYTLADLANSYYLASKPAWFGDRPWPPISPTNSSVYVTNLPAGYRYVFGTDPPAAAPQPPAAPLRARIRLQ